YFVFPKYFSKNFSKTRLTVAFRSHTITVNHFAYLVWPDHTAPYNPAPMVGCLKLCRQLAETIDYAWQKIRKNAEFQMIDAVKDLRRQRFHAIQSPIQYIFLHMCVLEMAAEVS
ncbi:unnamed protein product, partial [Angiostrongylus costaricensis]|uniref:PTPc_motif domain-containing protein n=1 Tax=Angiostrongylus costaricensis TaxID=334426 RepID=A0A0R3PC62_ANGCS